MLGKIDPEAKEYFLLYVAPWINGFCIALGLFVCALFAFLASVYLIGETEDLEIRAIFKKRALFSCVTAIVLGAAVFLFAEISGLPLAAQFFSQPISVSAFILATALWIPFWKSLSQGKRIFRTRFLGATVVALG